MTAISGQGEFGRRFAKALGLDPRGTRSITVRVPCDDVVLVTAEMFVQKDQFKELEILLKEFELHEKETADTGGG